MRGSRFQKFIFWLILVFIVIAICEGAGYLAMKYNSRGMDFLSNRTYFRIRDMLMDNKNPETFPKYLSQPYLAYIPFPGYTKNGEQQHNLSGYRGKAVPLTKDGNYRILCMGGSTTYGFKLDRFGEAYPAQLDSLLNLYFAGDAAFKSKYKGIEVMNAGLEAGASAEELAQYIFKYHYYKPDLVILQTGLNDALIDPQDTSYQPDYTHYRRMDFNLKPLPRQSAYLMHSYFFSYIIISLFYTDAANPFYYFEQDGTAKYARWNTLNEDSLIKHGNYEYYAFPHNLKSLISQIKMDSAQILLVPSVLNPFDKMVKENEGYRNRIALYNSMLREIANNGTGVYVDFTADSIDYARYGMDDCHLTAKGEQLKARLISHKAIQLIKQELVQ